MKKTKQAFAETVIVTYIYNDALPYFKYCLASIENQSYTDFDVIIFSDHVPIDSIPESKLNCKIIPVNGNPAEIRFSSLRYLRKTNYENILFIDSDDTMTENRVQVMTKCLEKNWLVCNDLNLIDNSGVCFNRSIWQSRLGVSFIFNHSFIEQFNIVGFGNTNIKRRLLDFDIVEDNKAIAVDWFIFYQLLFKSKQTAIFVTSCQTNYRQHPNNIAGIKNIDLKRIRHSIKVKSTHYNCLVNSGFPKFIPIVHNLLKLEDELSFEETLEFENVEFPFWWEETLYINN